MSGPGSGSGPRGGTTSGSDPGAGSGSGSGSGSGFGNGRRDGSLQTDDGHRSIDAESNHSGAQGCVVFNVVRAVARPTRLYFAE
jgi:hypothetical protein